VLQLTVRFLVTFMDPQREFTGSPFCGGYNYSSQKSVLQTQC